MFDAQPTVPIVPVVRIIARMNVSGPALQVSAPVDEIDPLRFEQLLLTRLVDRQEGDYLEPRSPKRLMLSCLDSSARSVRSTIGSEELQCCRRSRSLLSG